MKKIVRQLAKRGVLALALMSLCSLNVFAQVAHTHNQAEQNSVSNSDLQNDLVKVVRESTARFQDVKVAESAGYQFALGCVSGSDSGAMGLHYVNGALIGSGILDATRPQAVLYEARPDGSLRLTGVEFVVLADAWNAAHPDGPPQLMGQLFHFFERSVLCFFNYTPAKYKINQAEKRECPECKGGASFFQ